MSEAEPTDYIWVRRIGRNWVLNAQALTGAVIYGGLFIALVGFALPAQWHGAGRRRPHHHVIVATFAEDGPTQCSGLPVMRYSADALHAEFGAPFSLVQHDREAHHTPFGTIQQFTYCYCRTSVS